MIAHLLGQTLTTVLILTVILAQTEIVSPDDDFAESLLSNWEISDNGFDTDTGTSDLEEDVGFSDSGDEVLTPRS